MKLKRLDSQQEGSARYATPYTESQKYVFRKQRNDTETFKKTQRKKSSFPESKQKDVLRLYTGNVSYYSSWDLLIGKYSQNQLPLKSSLSHPNCSMAPSLKHWGHFLQLREQLQPLLQPRLIKPTC